VWSASSGSRLLLLAAGLLAASAAVLRYEARRSAPPGAWTALSGGLGLGSRAGTAAGWFLFDARLESLRDSALSPLPGVPASDGDGLRGGLELAPFASRPPR